MVDLSKITPFISGTPCANCPELIGRLRFLVTDKYFCCGRCHSTNGTRHSFQCRRENNIPLHKQTDTADW